MLTISAPLTVAQGANGVTVSVTAPDYVTHDSTFIAKLDITEVANFDSASYDVTFNPTIVEVTSITGGKIGGTDIPVLWNGPEPGRITIAQNVPGLTGVNGTGYLASISFHVLGSPVQTTNITLSNGVLGDNTAQAIPATWVGDLVHLTAHETATVSINATEAVYKNSDFSANVNISQVKEFDAANYEVSFNPAILRITGVTAGRIGGIDIPIALWNESQPGRVAVVQNIPGVQGASGSGYLATLGFRVLGSQGQTSNITLNNGVLSDVTAQEIPATWIGNSVNVVGVAATLASIAVTPANPSLAAGLTKQFNAIGTYGDNSTSNLTAAATWTSSNTSVATINSAGLAMANGVGTVGTTTITATSGNISGNTTLTVTPALLVSIAVTPPAPTVALGRTQQFTAAGTYTIGITANITGSVIWVSSNTSVATINSAGLATALAAGATTVTATLGAISGSTTLTVTDAELVSIAVTPVNPSIFRSLKQQFTATGTYSNASTANITGNVAWTSSNTAVATINSAGLATSLAAGATTITATVSAISGNTILTVTPVTTVEVNSGNTITLNTGATINATTSSGIAVAVKGLPNLSAPVNGLAGFRFDFTWNKNVINVNSAFKNNAAGWDTILPGTPNNTTGTLTSTGFTTTYATDDVTLIYLGVTAVGNLGDNTTLTVTITSLGDKDGSPISALALNAPVLIGNPLAAETGITLGLSGTTTDVVAVKVNVNRIKNQSDNLTALIPGGIGSYSATASGNPASSIQFLTVNGVSPFNSPSFNAATGVF
ncbi:MAG: Ig-like domain-containing protein, partial [Chloroflexota bacterium]